MSACASSWTAVVHQAVCQVPSTNPTPSLAPPAYPAAAVSLPRARLVGVLVGGELLTAIGACLFLRIEFGWPALISLLASLLALLISVRCHMRRVGEKALHRCHESATGNGGRLFEFLLPGPVTLTRFLLAVPVWPMLLVYSEGASFWPFSMASRGDHSLPPSEESLWANPWDWFRVSARPPKN